MPSDFRLDGDFQDELERQLRPDLERLGLMLTAHAIPHSGVDTGDLVASMGYAIDHDAEGISLVCGSHPETGQPVPYAGAHWAKRADLDVPPTATRMSRKKRPHPTRPAPTRPWTKAAREIGLRVTTEPGMPEA